MTRQYSSSTIDQLERDFEKASQEGDLTLLGQIAHELSFRKTARACKLAQRVGRTSPASLTQAGDLPLKGEVTPPKKSDRPRKISKRELGKTVGHSRVAFTPTDEQQQAVDLFGKGGSLKINAYAGAGKTSTLVLLANSTAKRGQYIAFNKAIVREAREKFPRTVNCSTTHGLAFRALAGAYGRNMDKLTGRINAHRLAEELKLERWNIDGKHALQPRSMAYLFQETVRRFCQSSEVEPNATHVPRHGSLKTAPKSTIELVEHTSLEFARYLWDRMRDTQDVYPLGHDGYLKLWALSQPVIGADFILLDEAQDTNPVVLDLLGKQPAQMVYVGDKYQQIYEWRGAVNAMEAFETDHSTSLRKSFRFGDVIAQSASKILRMLGESDRIVGNSAISSYIGAVTPRAVLARTNACAIGAVVDELDAGRKPCLVGDHGELMEMLRGVQDLKNGEQSTVPDFFGFQTWTEVVEFVRSGEAPHLLTFVNLVESRGEKQLMWALNRTVDEEVADVSISTAHKSKGREWSTVRLMDDFLKAKSEAKGDQAIKGLVNGYDPAEIRLFYVAMTRAKVGLELPDHLSAIV